MAFTPAKDAAKQHAMTGSQAGHKHDTSGIPAKPAASLVKDPTCGMMVNKATALKSERGGRSYYFCSPACQRTFEAPEAELKSGGARSKRRVRWNL